jgi:predicted SpoU family rRNA methylase
MENQKDPETEQELVALIKNTYWSLKKKNVLNTKLDTIFNTAIEKVFNKWGHLFDCKTTSDVKRIYNMVRRAEKQKNEYIVHPSLPAVQKEEVRDTLKDQILELGLNMDSYY